MSDLIQEQLQMLRDMRDQYQQRYDPAEQQRQLQARNQMIDRYQGVVDTPPQHSMGPVNTMVSSYLSKYTPGQGGTGMIRAIGETSELMRQRELEDRKRQLGEVGAVANMRDKVVGEEDRVLRDQLGLATKIVGRSAAGAGKPVVKMDKDGNMVSFDPTTGETKIVHSSQRGEYQRIWTKVYEKAVQESMPDPEQYAHSVAANVLGTAMVGGQRGGEPAQAAPTSPAIRYKDKPEEARAKEFATGTEKSAIDFYEKEIRPAAQSADSMLQTVGMIRQIPRTQDAFAPYREKLGSAFNALGLDGKMATEAENLQQLRPLLAKLANDRLLAAKGVQTEGDAQRAYNEFLKITDTQKAADFMYAWTEELANRAKFKDTVYRDAANTEKTMQKGADYWGMTDYAKTAPVALIGNRPWAFTDWRNKFLKMNPDATLPDAITEWNKLTRGGK